MSHQLARWLISIITIKHPEFVQLLHKLSTLQQVYMVLFMARCDKKKNDVWDLPNAVVFISV